MKKQKPRTARISSRISARTGATRHAKKRTALHRQIRDARALHHKIVLHPLSVMVLLAMGVLIVGWTLGVAADTYNVIAKVPAPPLTEGVVITDPTDGLTTQTSPIAITGTCPDSSYIKLTRNGVFSGVAICTSNTFSIQTSLSSGANAILAQDYNITDDPGPVTSGITVTYNPPIPPEAPPSTTPTGATSSTSGSSQPLLIVSDYHFQAFRLGSKFSWTLRVGGGAAPYTVLTDWGDKQSSKQVIPSAQDVVIEHTYARPGYYPIIVNLTDAKNAATVLQLAAFIQQPGAAGLFGITPDDTSGAISLPSFISSIATSGSWLWVAWPTYAVLVLMAVCFWLGERQELRRLLAAQHSRPTPRPHHR